MQFKQIAFIFALAFVTISAVTTPQDDLVKDFPLYGKHDFQVYSGMLNVTDSGSRQLHYVLLEAIETPVTEAPLVIWLNGGPGCSSLLGLIQENGPFMFEGNSETLSDNMQNSWNLKANMLYIEGPPGVGFSINTETIVDTDNGVDGEYRYSDEQTAEDFLAGFIQFRERFQNTLNFDNDLWMSGESYAGMYIPFFANQVLNYNKANPSTIFNLKGFLIGNGVMLSNDLKLFQFTMLQYVENQFFNYEDQDLFYDGCQAGKTTIESLTKCLKFLDVYGGVTDNTYPYQIYNYTYSYAQPRLEEEKLWQKEDQHTLEDLKQKVEETMLHMSKKQSERRCQKNRQNSEFEPVITPDQVIEQYFNSTTVKAALHVDENINFEECSYFVGRHYHKAPNSQIFYRQFAEAGLDMLIYNGNDDGVVTWQYQYYGLEDLFNNKEYNIELKEDGKWRQWQPISTQQVGGMVQYYKTSSGSRFAYAMVRGAGHEVPEYQKVAALHMFNNWIFDELI